MDSDDCEVKLIESMLEATDNNCKEIAEMDEKLTTLLEENQKIIGRVEELAKSSEGANQHISIPDQVQVPVTGINLTKADTGRMLLPRQKKLMQVNALDREKGRRLVRKLYGDKKGRRPTRSNKTSTSYPGPVNQVDPTKSGYGPVLEKLDILTDRMEQVPSLVTVNAVKGQQTEGATSGDNHSFLGMKPNVASSQTTSE